MKIALRHSLLFTLFLTTSSTYTTPLQNYEPATFWTLYARQGYQHGNDLENRLQRGPLFIKDMLRWAPENKHIPRHSFNKSSPSTIRIATYNVRFWTDPLNNPNVEAILNVIKTINADILILQESLWDANVLQNYGVDNLPVRFQKLGYIYGGLNTLSRIWAPNFKNYGTVIFSKFPLTQIFSDSYKSPLQSPKKQGYSHASVMLPNTTISVYGTHLFVESISDEPSKAEDVRLEQLRQLTEIIAKDPSPNAFIAADCNAVRKKDFNYNINGISAWELADQDFIGYVGIHRPTHALQHLLSKGFKNSFDLYGISNPKVTTWAGIPVDHIFLSPTWKLPIQGSYLFFDAASDHSPIICDVGID